MGHYSYSGGRAKAPVIIVEIGVEDAPLQTWEY